MGEIEFGKNKVFRVSDLDVARVPLDHRHL
jgi:hypothetical protein